MSTGSSVEHGLKVADALERSIAHADSEYVVPFSIDTVMATVSTQDSLTWSDSLVWVAPRFEEGAKLSLELATELSGVRAHYEWVGGAGERDRYELNARLSTDWWVIWDAPWFGVSPFTGERVASEAFSLHFMDGDGISGEMTSLRLTPPVHQTHNDRVQLLKGYFEAMKQADVERLVGMFSTQDYAGSVVRSYFGGHENGLAHLRDLTELREHYQQFHAAASVEKVVVTNWYIKDWYLFAEAQWTLRMQDGSRSHAATAEVLLLAADGGIAGRLGHGTHLEPAPMI